LENNQLIAFLFHISQISNEQKQQTDAMGKKRHKNDDKAAKVRQKLGKSVGGMKSDLSLSLPVRFGGSKYRVDRVDHI